MASRIISAAVESQRDIDCELRFGHIVLQQMPLTILTPSHGAVLDKTGVSLGQRQELGRWNRVVLAATMAPGAQMMPRRSPAQRLDD